MGSISMRLPSPSRAPQLDEDDFWYVFNPATLTALQAGVPVQLVLDDDSDFWWDRISVYSTQLLFSMSLVDNSRGLPIIGSADGQQVNGENLGVLGGLNALGILQFWLPREYRLRAGSQLTATFTNRFNGANTIQFALIGRKDFS